MGATASREPYKELQFGGGSKVILRLVWVSKPRNRYSTGERGLEIPRAAKV